MNHDPPSVLTKVTILNAFRIFIVAEKFSDYVKLWYMALNGGFYANIISDFHSAATKYLTRKIK
jgi:hypothetical protein